MIPLGLLQGLGAGRGILPPGMGLAPAAGLAGQAGALSAPSSSSLSVAPATPSAPPAASASYAPNPYTNSTGGANAGGGNTGGGNYGSSGTQYAGSPAPQGMSDLSKAAGTAAGAATTGQMSQDLDKIMPAIGAGTNPWQSNIPYTPAPSSGIDPYSQPGATIGTHDSPPSWLGGTGGASGIQTPTSIPGSYTNQIWDVLRGGTSVPPAPTGTLTPEDASIPFTTPSYSRTVSPTSVPGSYQPPGYLGDNSSQAPALPTLSPTSQPGFYHPPSITSGTGGANRGTEPDLYHGAFSPADLGLGGVSPAAATPAPAPTAPAVNPFAGLGNFFSPPSQQAVDQMAGGYGVAPPVNGGLPGFLESGGASHPVMPSYGTPRQPQYRPSVPGANPRPEQSYDAPEPSPSTVPPPYSDVGGPRVPQPRPDVSSINPFGFRMPSYGEPRIPQSRPDPWGDWYDRMGGYG